MATASELLVALPRHFESLAPTLASATRSLDFATRLYNFARDERISGRTSSSASLLQQLVAAARVLSNFTSEASRQAASGQVSTQLLAHVWAGVTAADACAVLACTVALLEPMAAFAIGTACSLVFGPGTTMLASAVLSQPPEVVLEFAKAQLGAVMLVVVDLLPPRHLSREAAAFARSTARPAVMLPWLGTLSKALVLHQNDTPPGLRTVICYGLVGLLHTLLHDECYARHQNQLAGDPALQQAVADAVLAQGLAGLPSLLSTELEQVPGVLRELPGVLWHPSLSAAVARRMHSPGGAAAVRHAVRTVEALPLSRPAGTPASLFVEMHKYAMLLLNVCSQLQLQQATASNEGQVRRASGSECTSSTPGPSSSSDSSSQQEQEAAWHLVAAFPQLAATLQALAADAEGPACPGWLDELDNCCMNAGLSLALLEAVNTRPASAAQLTSWAAAAAAAVRLRPLLSQLDSRIEPVLHGPEGDVPAAKGVQQSETMLRLLLCRRMPGLMPALEASSEDCKQLVAGLDELHSAVCRLAHYAASRGIACVACADGSAAELWMDLLDTLTLSFCRLMHARLSTRDIDPVSVQAWCIAHLHAVLAVAAAGAAEQAHCLRPAVLLEGLSVAVVQCALQASDAFLDGPVAAALESLVGHASEVSSPLQLASELLCPVAKVAACDPRLAAMLASGSLLGCMLQAAEHLAGGDEEAAEWGSKLISNLDAMMLSWGESMPDDPPEEVAHLGITAAMLAELQAAGAALCDRRRQLLAGLGPDASMAERAAQLRQLLPLAAHLAAHEQAHWEVPSMKQERQLKLARAAATRSCAYLRCANVAAQGGPAAGQGVGSARCSGCRAVWYCGTACSHADWRAGHKRVCKALAAERQAAKAARAAARAAAGGAGAAEQQQEEAEAWATV